MSQAGKSSAYMKAWRARKEQENPEYMELQRAKARERARAKFEANRDNPEHQEKERRRKKELQRKRRADPVKSAVIKQVNARSRAKSENKARQVERMKAWRDANKEAIKSYQKDWRTENADAISAYSSQYMKSYTAQDHVKKSIRERHLKKYYRMTTHDFNVLWERQSGKCAVCEVAMNPRGRESHAACVDHNHDTGEIRGLLCRACNHGIGNLKDDPRVLQRAADYLVNNGFYGGKKSPNSLKG